MATSNFSDYAPDASSNVSSVDAGNGSPYDKAKLWSLERLKRSYSDYLSSKVKEVEEQKDARRYRHASQWTNEQVKVFNKRKQPIVTYNRIGRKIDGVVGLIEKLKQSPKAYPRTPNEQGGADLATAVVREVLDSSEWKAKSYIVGQNAAIDGFGGVELMLVQGDKGDPDIDFEVVENDGFFYDPRSIRLDFSDCRYMGQGKWLDLDQAKEMFPDQADELEDAMDSISDLSTNSDREQKWFITDGYTKRIRVVDCWYILNGEWYWAIFTGTKKLDEGKSYFHDEKGKTFCKYLMFSASVDQDGDRYGFVRNLKSAQDEINQRRSKALHLLNTRRIVAEQGAFDDVEVARREAARPDGIVIRNKGFEAEFDDGSKNQEIQAHLQFLVDAKGEIENFGPNPALIGQGALGDKSGRAIQLLQQAGVAELGPFLLAYRGWKVRLYRAIWNGVKEHWKAERYIRVTDDQSVLQFIGINQVSVNPQTGMPEMVNHIAALDVDIIMDEGPDSINSMADTYDALIALVQNGTSVPPEILLELSPGIDPDTRKRLIEKLSAPNPQAQLEQQAAQAQIAKVMADTGLAKAKTIDTLRGESPQQGEQEHPAVIQANVENTQADTLHKKAQAMKTMQDAMMAPQQQAHDQAMDVHQANQSDQQMQMDNQPEPTDPKLLLTIMQHRDKMALEQKRLEMEDRHRSEDRKAKQAEKQDSGPKISLDGSVAEQVTKSTKEGSAQLGQVANVMAQAVAALARASEAMADNSKQLTGAVKELTNVSKAPRKLVRDKTGRASHTEVMMG